MSIKIATRQANGVTVLDTAGRITLGENGATFRSAIQNLLADGQQQLLINLAEVNYVDSAGIGTLIAVLNAVVGKGGKVKLLNLTKRVQDLLELTKTNTLFDIFDDEAAALSSFADSRANGAAR